MSFQRKLNKLKRDPKAFFEDSFNKQYGRAHTIISLVREEKDGILNTIKKVAKDPTYFESNSPAIVKKATGIIGSKKQTSSKLFKDYFEELTFFSEQYNVNSIQLNNKKIWPYLRNNLWIHMNFVAIGKRNWKNVTAVHIYNSHRSQITKQYRAEAQDIYNAKEIEDIDFQADIVFMVNMNSAEQVELDSGIYHRVTDPFYEVAKEVTKTIKVEMIKSSTPSIEKSTRYIYPTKIVLPPIIERIGFSDNLEYDGRLFSLMQKFVPSLNKLTPATLKSIVDYDMHTKQYYREMFERINPKVIFLYAFHYNAPMIEAADELGILTVDIQHGLQVGWNPLYTNYDEMPPEGYPQIPDIFAVWGEKEYNNIKYSLPSDKHRPMYMGAPWLEKIKTFPVSLSDHLIDELQNEKYKLRVLLIMQNQTDIPELFKDIIAQTADDDILWIIRHHPKGERYVAKDFSSKNGNILVDDELDSVLFSELFKFSDVTVSEGSALAIEASYFGITNIVTSEMGLDNYNKEVADGIFYYLQDAQDFKPILHKIFENKGKVDTSHLFKTVDTRKFIEQLLVEADNKKQVLKAKKVVASTQVREQYKAVEAQIVEQLEQANELAENLELDDAIATFKALRALLVNLPEAKNEYYKEEMLWVKDARVFQRKVRNKFEIASGKEDVLLIGDSLAMPRPLETRNVHFGMSRSYPYMFNYNSYGLTLLPWSQRYLTTTKLLNNWESLSGDLNNKHLVIHLGINDSAERIFSEEQRTAMASLAPEIRAKVVEFGKNYRKEIIESQDNFSYVPFDQFEANVQQIVARALDGGVQSLTFIGIIPFPKSHEADSPGAIENCNKYNAVFVEASKRFDNVGYIDIVSVLNNVENNAGVLTDDVHLSIPGHRALASAIFSKISVNHSESRVQNVALIGVGNLGSRHLQGIAKSKNALNIECFEPSQANIKTALARFKEVIDNEKGIESNHLKLNFVDSIQSLSSNIDLAIVSTNSDIRANVVEELLTSKHVKNLILEKVLFQDVASYSKIENLIEDKEVKAWVNHPRRLFNIHAPFLADIRKSKKLSFQVSGVNWGLGSNGLHFLDLLAWLTNTEQQAIELEWNKIGRSVAQSKRPQFKEIYGTISGMINNNVSFSITSLPPTSNEAQMPTISIVSDFIKLFIDEYNGVVNYAFANDNWQWHTLEGDFPLLFQSQMTATVIDGIIENHECALPTYKTSMWLHVPFITTIKEGIEELEGEYLEICPIS